MHCWQHMAKHCNLHHQLKQHSKQRRKEEILEVTDKACGAAHCHDSRGLYEAIKALTRDLAQSH